MNIIPALFISFLWSFPMALALTVLIMAGCRGFRIWASTALWRILVVSILICLIYAAGIVTAFFMEVRQ